MATSLKKKTKLKSDPLTDTGTLLLIEKGVRREICRAIHQYSKFIIVSK